MWILAPSSGDNATGTAPATPAAGMGASAATPALPPLPHAPRGNWEASGRKDDQTIATTSIKASKQRCSMKFDGFTPRKLLTVSRCTSRRDRKWRWTRHVGAGLNHGLAPLSSLARTVMVSRAPAGAETCLTAALSRKPPAEEARRGRKQAQVSRGPADCSATFIGPTAALIRMKTGTGTPVVECCHLAAALG